MKLRMIAVVLILAPAAWLPAAAQQTSGSQPAPSTGSKPSAWACCDHKAHPGDEAKNAQASSSCCHGKDGDRNAKDCCKEHAKGNLSAMNCCKRSDGKMCARDGKDGKSCCGKDAVTCNTKDGKNCCASAEGHCSDCL